MYTKYLSAFCRNQYHHKQQLFTIKRYKNLWNYSIKSKMPIKAALIDLSGTLHVEDQPTPDAVNALQRLRDSGVMIKFVTNTTKESRQTLLKRLQTIGFQVDKDEIHSSLSAAVEYIKRENLNPFYLVSKDARSDFPANDEGKPYDSVAIGLAPDEFFYENLNKAFNILLANKEHKLIAIHEGKYYKRKDGLALGPGCFVKGLEYATGTKSILIGKPNEYFFKSALSDDINVEECVMIGDDTKDDIVGAMKVGLKGLQVKTGKYLPDVVAEPPPTALVENFSEAVDWILKNK
ncbi:haloacid dehalogenase-like hydrolase domain-containing protein 2 [Lucilia sericata]|uniref:haloacid dehalogenase-like hydrolase domain-containing protein 2 n=1 Tax=Lucilia sericata TaxID=13632 RepID=UPI0018A863CE|nr:haloacid dehalogenase-like hydrolase domain-containing protein 2 [Lucilia sericata]XP_037816576.1 haloacid dehalogenase-like hydrolase domain-containing protein 2 [Lucilia sericata]XP_037816577.1 haloacid dehalogenase-like hydrolase domain-containing protein 2 [Lucilia sericata]